MPFKYKQLIFSNLHCYFHFCLLHFQWCTFFGYSPGGGEVRLSYHRGIDTYAAGIVGYFIRSSSGIGKAKISHSNLI